MAGRSMNSSATGMMPEPMMASTQAPAVSLASKPTSMARWPSGLRKMRTVTSVTIASMPSLPVSRPSQIVAGGVEMSAPDVEDFALDGDDA